MMASGPSGRALLRDCGPASTLEAAVTFIDPDSLIDQQTTSRAGHARRALSLKETINGQA